MKTNICLLLALFVFVLKINAQENVAHIIKSDWAEKPETFTLTEEEQKLPLVILKEHKVFEYVVAGDEQYQLELKNYIIKLNSDDAINSNNKIYTPVSDPENILILKARVINSKGVIKELNKENIKEGTNEEQNTTYKYFALDGIDIGSTIEYFHLLKVPSNYTGSSVTLQSTEYKKNVDLELIYPAHLVFHTKCYNSAAPMLEDTTIANKTKLYSHADVIKPLKDEIYGNQNDQLQRIAWILYANNNTSKNNFFNYNNISTNLFEVYTIPPTKAEEKKLAKLISTMKLDPKADHKEIIRNMESYIKLNYSVVEYDDIKYLSLTNILDNKVMSEFGAIRLWYQLLSHFDIKHEVVITSNRYQLKFDPDFETYSHLKNYLIYFPDYDTYINPSALNHRFGLVPYSFTNNHGLFIKKFTLNNVTTGVGKIQKIEPLPYDRSIDSMVLRCQIQPDADKTTYTNHLSMSGYPAAELQYVFDYIQEGKLDETKKDIAKIWSGDGDIKNYTFQNLGGKNVGNKDMKVDITIERTDLLQQAGNQLLFKIGDLIGKQQEMYKNEERKLPIELNYLHEYRRILHITIPDGYKIINPEKLIIDQSMSDSLTFFRSSYEFSGNQLTVHITESYRQLQYPASLIDPYRSVINAAADFNKIVLILEKL